MLFNSLEYILFLTLCVSIYWKLKRPQQNIFLLVASYLFYSCWDYRFLSLIMTSTIVDFWAGNYIYKAQADHNQIQKKFALTVSICINLGILGFFKYCNFFVSEAADLLSAIGLSLSTQTLSIILPVGISFYTFQTMSYTIDIYRGDLQPTKKLLDFALFIAFFPQLVAGPIERARSMLPQITSNRQFEWEDVTKGLWFIIIGLFRKLVIADTAAVFVDPYFRDPTQFTSLELAIGLCLYSLQIYGDFAGYSDIARGSARLFGIRLMRNFEHPYFSKSITEFWRHWHISFSSWLRDYLYIPLGGSRRGDRRTYFNLLVTMLLGGLWHGASWNFVVWGGLHGFYLAVHRYSRAKKTTQGKHTEIQSLVLIKQIGIFCLVAFTWIFFRSDSFSTTLLYLKQLTSLTITGFGPVVPLLFISGATLLVDIPQHVTNNELFVTQKPWLIRTIIAVIALILMAISGVEQEPFIYFQF